MEQGEGGILTLLGHDDNLAISRSSKNKVNTSSPTHGARKTMGSGYVVQGLTDAKSINSSTIRCEVNMTKKYIVASLTIVSRIVGIPGSRMPPGLRLTQTTIKKTKRSVNGRFFQSREGGKSERAL